MSEFTNFDVDLKIQYAKESSEILGEDHWIVTEAFTYWVGSLDSKVTVTVPKGYISDGASVPKVFQCLLPNWSNYGQAAVLHDWLCDFGYVMNNGKKVMITRKEADEIFNEALKVLKVAKAKRHALKYSVALYRNTMKPKIPGIKPEKEREYRRILLALQSGKLVL